MKHIHVHSLRKGFTLIELLVVIAIIGLLGSIVYASLGAARARSRDARRISDLRQIALALELFYNTQGHFTGPEDCGHDTSIGGSSGSCVSPVYPDGSNWASASDLRDLVSAGLIPTLPTDPVNNATYYYRYEPQDGARPQDYALCARLEGGGFIWQGEQNSGGYFNYVRQPTPMHYCDAFFSRQGASLSQDTLQKLSPKAIMDLYC